MPLPTILVTGTPGTGKTSLSEQLVEALKAVDLSYTHINVSEYVKENKLYTEYDEHWATYIYDEDPLLDALEEEISQRTGGAILDWHTCDIFPERWIDLVVVLRCDHTVLWNRLEKRSYALHKIQENNEAEIMNVVRDEAVEAYPNATVVELASGSIDDAEENVERVVQWVQDFQKNNAGS